MACLEVDLEAGAPEGRVSHIDERSVGGRYLGDYGKAQARAAGIPVSGLIEPNESLEYAPPLGLGDARAVIVDDHSDTVGVFLHGERDHTSSMAGRVVDEIAYQFAKLRRIATNSTGRYAGRVNLQICRRAQPV